MKHGRDRVSLSIFILCIQNTKVYLNIFLIKLRYQNVNEV